MLFGPGGMKHLKKTKLFTNLKALKVQVDPNPTSFLAESKVSSHSFPFLHRYITKLTGR